jgi:hypothetical protein
MRDKSPDFEVSGRWSILCKPILINVNDGKSRLKPPNPTTETWLTNDNN